MLIKYFVKFQKRVALIDAKTNEQSTYKQLIKRIKYYDQFIDDNSVIMIIVSNNINTIEFYLACLNSKKKCITMVLDETFNKNYIETIIKKYKPNLIFNPKKILIGKFLNKRTVVNDQIISKTNFKNNKFNSINKLLLTTSGTTGSSKFVRFSKNNLVSNSRSIIKSLKIKKNHIVMTTMPMGYSYGLSILNTHLMSGAKIIINRESLLNKNFWIYLKKYKVNSLNGVPSFYNYLKKLDFKKFNLKKLLYLSQAGGNLDIEVKNYLYKFVKKLKIKLYFMYGQTEASPRISCFDVIKYPKKIGSVGRAIDGVSVGKVNEKKKYSELYVKGKNVCLGYAENIFDLKKGDVNKKFLKTGDVGYLDKERFIFIKGRIKRFSKLYGFRINLDEIEMYLKKMSIFCKCFSDDNKIFIKYLNSKNVKNIKKILFSKFNINSNSLELIKVKKLDQKITLKNQF